MYPKIPKPILPDLKKCRFLHGVFTILSTQNYLTRLSSNSVRNLELEDIYFKKLNRRELARAEYYVEKRKTDKFRYESKFHEQMVW